MPARSRSKSTKASRAAAAWEEARTAYLADLRQQIYAADEDGLASPEPAPDASPASGASPAAASPARAHPEPVEGSGSPTDPALDFDPAPTRNRFAGWTAERQRRFIDHLALTGCVGEAAGCVGVTSRSAYMLRNRAGAGGFARAWDAALHLAATRLAAVAFDRALHGRSERIYKDGELVLERRLPSDYLLTWLLARLDPLQFGTPAARALAAATGNPREGARDSLPALAVDFIDVDESDCPAEIALEIDQRLGEMG